MSGVNFLREHYNYIAKQLDKEGIVYLDSIIDVGNFAFELLGTFLNEFEIREEMIKYIKGGI